MDKLRKLEQAQGYLQSTSWKFWLLGKGFGLYQHMVLATHSSKFRW